MTDSLSEVEYRTVKERLKTQIWDEEGSVFLLFVLFLLYTILYICTFTCGGSGEFKPGHQMFLCLSYTHSPTFIFIICHALFINYE